MQRSQKSFAWLELIPKSPRSVPCEHGWWRRWYCWLRGCSERIHASGYRFFRLVGVSYQGDHEIKRDALGQWHDHAMFYGPVNIDITKEGVLRVCPGLDDSDSEWVVQGPPFVSFFDVRKRFSTDG